jgi:hypothetical protein
VVEHVQARPPPPIHVGFAPVLPARAAGAEPRTTKKPVACKDLHTLRELRSQLSSVRNPRTGNTLYPGFPRCGGIVVTRGVDSAGNA